ncbi:MAG: hypothetical protein ACYC25_02980 [Paludibacter sp.]
MALTDCRRMDFRIEVLRLTITGLENSILVLKTKYNEIDWYDGLWLLEESEPIFGLAFIAIQNYINSSIYDRFESLEKQYLIYKIGDKIEDSGRTKIELIIAIANYFKHRDHPLDLKVETAKTLTNFNLKFDKDIDISESPVFKGLDIFSESWDLKKVLIIAENWREKLWEIED